MFNIIDLLKIIPEGIQFSEDTEYKRGWNDCVKQALKNKRQVISKKEKCLVSASHTLGEKTKESIA